MISLMSFPLMHARIIAVSWRGSIDRNTCETQVYIGNLPERADDHDLREFFKPYGDRA